MSETTQLPSDDADVGEFEIGLLSARLADMLQAAILSGEFRLGDALPTERELMARHGISRATVREALRSLQAQGLIEARRGRNGGSYVCGPTSRTLRASIDLFITGHTIKYSDLIAAREAIEPIAAAQAALNRSEKDLDLLLDLTRAGEQHVGDLKRFSEINIEWHLAIVNASHNPLFIGFMSSISAALFSATNRQEFDLATRKVVVPVHWKIFHAIRDQDPIAARRRMGGHVEGYSQHLALEDAAETIKAAKRSKERKPR